MFILNIPKLFRSLRSLPRQSYEDGRQHREDVGLNERHKQFQTIHEHTKQHRHDRKAAVQSGSKLSGQEYHGHNSKNHEVSREDVGEKPDHQAERLCEYADDLNRRHQRQRYFQPSRDLRPKNILPVMLVTEYIDNEEGEQRQHERHGDVAGDVSSSGEERHDPHQVVNEYEEKRCQKVRRVPLVVLSHTAFDDIILDHRHEHLHQTDSAFRSLLTGIVLPVPFGGSEHDEQQQSTVDHQAEHVLRDGKVPRPHLGAVSGTLDYLILVLAPGRGDVEAFIFPVLQMPGTEYMEAVPGFAHDYYRQRDADRMAFHSGDVPLVGVADVAIEIFIHIEATALPLRGQRQRKQKTNEYVDPLSHHSSTQATT